FAQDRTPHVLHGERVAGRCPALQRLAGGAVDERVREGGPVAPAARFAAQQAPHAGHAPDHGATPARRPRRRFAAFDEAADLRSDEVGEAVEAAARATLFTRFRSEPGPAGDDFEVFGRERLAPFGSVAQWAAVSTCVLSMTDPPQSAFWSGPPPARAPV